MHINIYSLDTRARTASACVCLKKDIWEMIEHLNANRSKLSLLIQMNNSKPYKKIFYSKTTNNYETQMKLVRRMLLCKERRDLIISLKAKDCYYVILVY